MSIRRKLILGAFLIGTIPLAVLALFLPPRVERSLMAAGEDKLVLSARGQASLIQQMLMQHIETLRVISNSEFLNQQIVERNGGRILPENLAILNRRLQGFMNAFDFPYESVFVCDAQGTIFAGRTKSGDQSLYTNLDVSKRSYYLECLKTIKPTMEGPIVSYVTGAPIVVVAVPILSPQKGFYGLVGIAVDSRYLASVVLSSDLGKSGFAFAIDRDGRIAAHASPAQILAGDLSRFSKTDRLASRMKAGETGLEIYESPSGEVRVAAFAPVPCVGWSVASTQSESVFTEDAHRLRVDLLIGIGVCAGLAILAAFFYARGLTSILRHAVKVVADAGRNVDNESEEITRRATALSNGASLQSTGVLDVSDAVNELATTIKSNSIRASAVAAIVRRADSKIAEVQLRVAERIKEEYQGYVPASASTAFRGVMTNLLTEEFKPVRADAQKVGVFVDEIAIACVEQAKASRRVSDTMYKFEEGAQAGAETAKQSAEAAELLKAQVKEILKETLLLQQLIDGKEPPVSEDFRKKE